MRSVTAASGNSPPTPSAVARRLGAVTLLGFASGLPLALTDSTLQAWLTVAGVDVAAIGALSLAGMPYLFKFLWAPLLDRYAVPGTGRRRGWLLLSQGLLVMVIGVFGGLDPARDLPLVAAFALLLAAVSATQDIVIDAYRADVLAPRERGLGAGLSVGGYRLAMIASGAGALWLADALGFAASYAAMAGLMALGVAGSLVGPEPPPVPVRDRGLSAAFAAPLQILLTRPGITIWLVLIVLYKLGDAYAGRLTMTFFIRAQGFSLTEIGAVYKALGIGASLFGGLVGGALMYRLGLYRALWWFAILQAVTNLGFLILAWTGKSLLGMVIVVGLENLSGGMGTSALLALIMGLCDVRYTATHFALLSAVASLARVLTGPAAGQTVEAIGWAGYFASSFLLALPVLVALAAMRGRIDELDGGDRRPAQ